MQTTDQSSPGLRGRLLRFFGLTDRPTLKMYHGYGYGGRLTVYGHLLSLGPLPRTRYSKSVVNNTLALLRLFMVRPIEAGELELHWEGRVYKTVTEKDGFFRFDWVDEPPLPQGWKEVEVRYIKRGTERARAKGSVLIPFPTQYGFISDIDDTFLISHSAHLRKRLFVLFTQNARSRQPFEGSVKHYRLLAAGNTTPDAPNPFFFVSSSEWNLYEYILEFTSVQGMPRGVFLLNTLKRFRQLVQTGQSSHHTKFARIVRILETYPTQRFVLLGDSSQQDPYIYEAIVRHFPKRIHAVYIRDVLKKNRHKAADVLRTIESAGVPCCFFTHSSEAILHSRKIGLISSADAV